LISLKKSKNTVLAKRSDELLLFKVLLYNNCMPRQENPKLTEEQKQILFDRATEPPFSGDLLENDKPGEYACANCGRVLFSSETKFDNGSGWPSFYNVNDTDAVRLVQDNSHGMKRVEVTCANCGAHMGHVFNDAADQPTGMQFCINSLSLDFTEEDTEK
jgi:peptide-methionine (R)-S-oxide reductase